eukprot:PhM_4_TR13355/c0_g1_i1/m.92062
MSADSSTVVLSRTFSIQRLTFLDITAENVQALSTRRIYTSWETSTQSGTTYPTRLSGFTASWAQSFTTTVSQHMSPSLSEGGAPVSPSSRGGASIMTLTVCTSDRLSQTTAPTTASLTTPTASASTTPRGGGMSPVQGSAAQGMASPTNAELAAMGILGECRIHIGAIETIHENSVDIALPISLTMVDGSHVQGVLEVTLEINNSVDVVIPVPTAMHCSRVPILTTVSSLYFPGDLPTTNVIGLFNATEEDESFEVTMHPSNSDVLKCFPSSITLAPGAHVFCYVSLNYTEMAKKRLLMNAQSTAASTDGYAINSPLRQADVLHDLCVDILPLKQRLDVFLDLPTLQSQLTGHHHFVVRGILSFQNNKQLEFACGTSTTATTTTSSSAAAGSTSMPLMRLKISPTIINGIMSTAAMCSGYSIPTTDMAATMPSTSYRIRMNTLTENWSVVSTIQPKIAPRPSVGTQKPVTVFSSSTCHFIVERASSPNTSSDACQVEVAVLENRQYSNNKYNNLEEVCVAKGLFCIPIGGLRPSGDQLTVPIAILPTFSGYDAVEDMSSCYIKFNVELV